MNKLKVALCFSGQMRNFEDCVSSLYEYFLPKDKYEVDIFVSTWEERGANTINPGEKNNRSEIITEDLIKEHFDNVRSVEIQDFKQVCPDRVYQQIGLLLPMYYKIWRADKLRQDYEESIGTKYDWVIRSRADILYRKDTEFSLEDLDPNIMYHSRGTLVKWKGEKYKSFWKNTWLSPAQYQKIYEHDVTIDKSLAKPNKKVPVGLHDMFAIAKPELIKAYTESWLYLDNWIKSGARGKIPFHVKPRSASHPHELLIYRIWAHGIETKSLDRVVYLTYRGPEQLR